MSAQEDVLEEAARRLGGNGASSSKTNGNGDILGKAVSDALEKNPQILDGMKKYFSVQVVKVGAAMAMFDMATVSLGLALVDTFRTQLAWIPISAALYIGTLLILRRVVR